LSHTEQGIITHVSGNGISLIPAFRISVPSKRPSPSTDWTCRPRCTAAWRLPTSSKVKHAGVRIQTRHVTHWQNGKMVLRWMASAFIRTGKRFNRIMGHKDLWALEAILNPTTTASKKAA